MCIADSSKGIYQLNWWRHAHILHVSLKISDFDSEIVSSYTYGERNGAFYLQKHGQALQLHVSFGNKSIVKTQINFSLCRALEMI